MPLHRAATDANISFSDITTNNASTTKHGFLKKLDNSATNFMNGQGNWAAPGVSSAGLQNGTSNPGSPSTNDLFFRTDLGLIIYYTGTAWHTTTLYIANASIGDRTMQVADANSLLGLHRMPVLDEFGVHMVDLLASIFVSTTNSGVSFWTVDFDRLAADNTATTIATFNSSADAADTWVRKRVAIDATLDSGARALRTTIEDTGSPGGIFVNAAYSYRLIVT